MKADFQGVKPASKTTRCYETHPPLLLAGKSVYGGSCIYPVVKDADVYVGLDSGMDRSHKSYPWEQGDSFLFYIADMGVPKSPEQFKKLITYLAESLDAGKKVHIGCIGGHGRTGTVLAALAQVITGEKDAITYVRENYCKKAVESHEQVSFLAKHFGVTPVMGAKEYPKAVPSIGAYYGAGGFTEQSLLTRDYEAMPLTKAKSSVWGSDVAFTFDKLGHSAIITV